MNLPLVFRSRKGKTILIQNQQIEDLKNSLNKTYNEHKLTMAAINLDHEGELRKFQNLNISVLNQVRDALDNMQNKYQWNKYTDYSQAVDYIYRMACMTEKWGTLTSSLIEIRSALVGGNGIDVIKVREDAEREEAFLNEWLTYNEFNRGRELTIIEESEKEGKCCLHLIWDKNHEWQWIDSTGKTNKETGMVKVNFFDWYGKKYTVIPNQIDENRADKIIYSVSDSEKTLNSKEFAYRKFRGLINDLNSAVPKIWPALSDIWRFDETLFDLYLNNHLFSAPIPTYNAKTPDQTASNQEALGDLNWKVRKSQFVTETDFKMVTPSNAQSIALLIEELKTHVKIISGKMQIPPQFLGFTEDMKNKNVSENLMEGINASIQKDRQTYESCISEAAVKSMKMRTEKTKLEPLDTSGVKLEIGAITTADYNRLRDIFIPGFEKGIYSRELVLEKTPGVDAVKEEERAIGVLSDEFRNEIIDNERNKKIIKDENKEE